MKKWVVIGHFGFGKTLINGQTIKTQNIFREMENQLGSNQVLPLDTHGRFLFLFQLIFRFPILVKKYDNIIILPGINGLRVIVPWLSFINWFHKINVHYIVIGGWLAKLIEKNKSMRKKIARFRGIYVETVRMKKELEALGLHNLYYFPNGKRISTESTIPDASFLSPPFRICTFSRVMREKGIEIAIEVVTKINQMHDQEIYHLDIYGPIDPSYQSAFRAIMENVPSYIVYKGEQDPNQSVRILRDYFFLLFPTFYEGEGFAGTLIDAFSAGLPVVASEWKFNDEIINDQVGFLFPLDNMDFLSSLLVDISKNPSRINSLKGNCIKYSENFDISKIISRFLSIQK